MGRGAVQGDTQSFIIRIWHEAVSDDGRVLAWRGSIDHVGSSRRIYFQDMEQAIHFIAQEAGIHTGEEEAEAK